jgi:hypothetical protein
MHDLLILAHIVAGTVGLAAGPVAGLARKQHGLHTVAGWTYQICCAVLCTSALALVAMQPALWGFAVIAVLTEAAAVGAVVVRRRRRSGWQPKHVQLVLSSYVSFVTGLVVQTAGGLWWVVPVVIGSTVVSVVTGRVAASSSVRQEQHRVAELVPQVALGDRLGIGLLDERRTGQPLEQQQVAGLRGVQPGDQASDDADGTLRAEHEVGPATR